MTFTETVSLTKIDCGRCGGSYAINERYRLDKFRLGGFWACPYCKCEWGYEESENEKLRKELERTQVAARQAKCEAMEERHKREETETKLNKVQHRVKNGVCPCCRRSFQNLRRHMATKHPEAFKK